MERILADEELDQQLQVNVSTNDTPVATNMDSRENSGLKHMCSENSDNNLWKQHDYCDDKRKGGSDNSENIPEGSSDTRSTMEMKNRGDESKLQHVDIFGKLSRAGSCRSGISPDDKAHENAKGAAAQSEVIDTQREGAPQTLIPGDKSELNTAIGSCVDACNSYLSEQELNNDCQAMATQSEIRGQRENSDASTTDGLQRIGVAGKDFNSVNVGGDKLDDGYNGDDNDNKSAIDDDGCNDDDFDEEEGMDANPLPSTNHHSDSDDNRQTTNADPSAPQGGVAVRPSTSRGRMRPTGRSHAPTRPLIPDTGLNDDFADEEGNEVFFFVSDATIAETAPDMTAVDILATASAEGLGALWDAPGAAPFLSNTASAPEQEDEHLVPSTPYSALDSVDETPPGHFHPLLNRSETLPYQHPHGAMNAETSPVHPTILGSDEEPSLPATNAGVHLQLRQPVDLIVIGRSVTGGDEGGGGMFIDDADDEEEEDEYMDSIQSMSEPPSHPSPLIRSTPPEPPATVIPSNLSANIIEGTVTCCRYVVQQTNGPTTDDRPPAELPDQSQPQGTIIAVGGHKRFMREGSESLNLDDASNTPSEDQEDTQIETADAVEENLEATETDLESQRIASAENDFLSLDVRRNSSSPIIAQRERTELDADKLLDQIIGGYAERGMGPNAALCEETERCTSDPTTCLFKPKRNRGGSSEDIQGVEACDDGEDGIVRRRDGGCDECHRQGCCMSPTVQDHCASGADTDGTASHDETSHGIPEIHTNSGSHGNSQGAHTDSLVDTSGRTCSSPEDEFNTSEQGGEAGPQNIQECDSACTTATPNRTGDEPEDSEDKDPSLSGVDQFDPKETIADMNANLMNQSHTSYSKSLYTLKEESFQEGDTKETNLMSIQCNSKSIAEQVAAKPYVEIAHPDIDGAKEEKVLYFPTRTNSLQPIEETKNSTPVVRKSLDQIISSSRGERVDTVCQSQSPDIKLPKDSLESPLPAPSNDVAKRATLSVSVPNIKSEGGASTSPEPSIIQAEPELTQIFTDAHAEPEDDSAKKPNFAIAKAGFEKDKISQSETIINQAEPEGKNTSDPHLAITHVNSKDSKPPQVDPTTTHIEIDDEIYRTNTTIEQAAPQVGDILQSESLNTQADSGSNVAQKTEPSINKTEPDFENIPEHGSTTSPVETEGETTPQCGAPITLAQPEGDNPANSLTETKGEKIPQPDLTTNAAKTEREKNTQSDSAMTFVETEGGKIPQSYPATTPLAKELESLTINPEETEGEKIPGPDPVFIQPVCEACDGRLDESHSNACLASSTDRPAPTQWLHDSLDSVVDPVVLDMSPSGQHQPHGVILTAVQDSETPDTQERHGTAVSKAIDFDGSRVDGPDKIALSDTPSDNEDLSRQPEAERDETAFVDSTNIEKRSNENCADPNHNINRGDEELMETLSHVGNGVKRETCPDIRKSEDLTSLHSLEIEAERKELNEEVISVQNKEDVRSQESYRAGEAHPLLDTFPQKGVCHLSLTKKDSIHVQGQSPRKEEERVSPIQVEASKKNEERGPWVPCSPRGMIPRTPDVSLHSATSPVGSDKLSPPRPVRDDKKRGAHANAVKCNPARVPSAEGLLKMVRDHLEESFPTEGSCGETDVKIKSEESNEDCVAPSPVVKSRESSPHKGDTDHDRCPTGDIYLAAKPCVINGDGTGRPKPGQSPEEWLRGTCAMPSRDEDDVGSGVSIAFRPLRMTIGSFNPLGAGKLDTHVTLEEDNSNQTCEQDTHEASGTRLFQAHKEGYVFGETQNVEMLSDLKDIDFEGTDDEKTLVVKGDTQDSILNYKTESNHLDFSKENGEVIPDKAESYMRSQMNDDSMQDSINDVRDPPDSNQCSRSVKEVEKHAEEAGNSREYRLRNSGPKTSKASISVHSDTERALPTATPGEPQNLGIVDYIRACEEETYENGKQYRGCIEDGNPETSSTNLGIQQELTPAAEGQETDPPNREQHGSGKKDHMKCNYQKALSETGSKQGNRLSPDIVRSECKQYITALVNTDAEDRRTAGENIKGTKFTMTTNSRNRNFGEFGEGEKTDANPDCSYHDTDAAHAKDQVYNDFMHSSTVDNIGKTSSLEGLTSQNPQKEDTLKAHLSDDNTNKLLNTEGDDDDECAHGRGSFKRGQPVDCKENAIVLATESQSGDASLGAKIKSGMDSGSREEVNKRALKNLANLGQTDAQDEGLPEQNATSFARNHCSVDPTLLNMEEFKPRINDQRHTEHSSQPAPVSLAHTDWSTGRSCEDDETLPKVEAHTTTPVASQARAGVDALQATRNADASQNTVTDTALGAGSESKETLKPISPESSIGNSCGNMVGPEINDRPTEPTEDTSKPLTPCAWSGLDDNERSHNDIQRTQALDSSDTTGVITSEGTSAFGDNDGSSDPKSGPTMPTSSTEELTDQRSSLASDACRSEAGAGDEVTESKSVSESATESSVSQLPVEKVILEATDVWLRRISDFCKSPIVLADSRSDAKLHQFTAECKSHILSISKCKFPSSASDEAAGQRAEPAGAAEASGKVQARGSGQNKTQAAKPAFSPAGRCRTVRPSAYLPTGSTRQPHQPHQPRQPRVTQPKPAAPHPPHLPPRDASRDNDGEPATSPEQHTASCHGGACGSGDMAASTQSQPQQQQPPHVEPHGQPHGDSIQQRMLPPDVVGSNANSASETRSAMRERLSLRRRPRSGPAHGPAGYMIAGGAGVISPQLRGTETCQPQQLVAVSEEGAVNHGDGNQESQPEDACKDTQNTWPWQRPYPRRYRLRPPAQATSTETTTASSSTAVAATASAAAAAIDIAEKQQLSPTTGKPRVRTATTAEDSQPEKMATPGIAALKETKDTGGLAAKTKSPKEKKDAQVLAREKMAAPTLRKRYRPQKVMTVKEFEREQLSRHLSLDFRRISKTGPSVDCHMDPYLMSKSKGSVEKQRAKNNYNSLLALENCRFLHVLRYTKSVYRGNASQATGSGQQQHQQQSHGKKHKTPLAASAQASVAHSEPAMGRHSLAPATANPSRAAWSDNLVLWASSGLPRGGGGGGGAPGFRCSDGSCIQTKVKVRPPHPPGMARKV